MNKSSNVKFSDSIYFNAMMFCRRISDIRLFLDYSHKKTLEPNLFISEYPRLGKKYLPTKEYDFLLRLGMKILPKKFKFQYYLLNKEDYDAIQAPDLKINVFKYRALRDYFVIKRIQRASQKNELDITLAYRPAETNIDSSKEYSTSNSSFIDSLKNQEDILCEVNTEDQTFREKFRNYLIPFIFNDLNILPNTPISLKERPPKTKSAKGRGYILMKDKRRFDRIDNVSFSNLKLLIDDFTLYDKLYSLVREFEKNKIGY